MLDGSDHQITNVLTADPTCGSEETHGLAITAIEREARRSRFEADVASEAACLAGPGSARLDDRIVDRHGLPLSVSTHAANHHEVRLVQLCFDFYMIEAKPENLIGDRAYDSDPLDHALRQDGIEMIAPHRSNRTKPPTQDRRRLRRFLRRWLVERFFAWIQWQRRILVRWEYHPENFLGFVQLACLVVLFRRF